MKFKAVRDLIRGISLITKSNARYLYDLILRERRTSVLELGIAHGAGTCYIAAALEELGAGSVTAVDLLGAGFNPSAERTFPARPGGSVPAARALSPAQPGGAKTHYAASAERWNVGLCSRARDSAAWSGRFF
jgi:hypothetical protein